jgi:hypothetical protein
MPVITCDYNAAASTYTLTIKDGSSTITVGSLTAVQLKPIAERMGLNTMQQNHDLYPSVQRWVGNIQ